MRWHFDLDGSSYHTTLLLGSWPHLSTEEVFSSPCLYFCLPFKSRRRWRGWFCTVADTSWKQRTKGNTSHWTKRKRNNNHRWWYIYLNFGWYSSATFLQIGKTMLVFSNYVTLYASTSYENLHYCTECSTVLTNVQPPTT